jgi:hypothetical protein
MRVGALPDGPANAPHREPSGSNTQLPTTGRYRELVRPDVGQER